MSTDKNDRDIEIIPPDRSGSRQESEWVFVTFEDRARAYRELPLYKRILFAAASIGGLIALGVILFLILASAVLIWIPLMIATALIAAAVMFFRTKFGR